MQAPDFGDIRLTVDAIPEVVAMEKTFVLTCKVTNCS